MCVFVCLLALVLQVHGMLVVPHASFVPSMVLIHKHAGYVLCVQHPACSCSRANKCAAGLATRLFIPLHMQSQLQLLVWPCSRVSCLVEREGCCEQQWHQQWCGSCVGERGSGVTQQVALQLT